MKESDDTYPDRSRREKRIRRRRSHTDPTSSPLLLTTTACFVVASLWICCTTTSCAAASFLVGHGTSSFARKAASPDRRQTYTTPTQLALLDHDLQSKPRRQQLFQGQRASSSCRQQNPNNDRSAIGTSTHQRFSSSLSAERPKNVADTHHEAAASSTSRRNATSKDSSPHDATPEEENTTRRRNVVQGLTAAVGVLSVAPNLAFAGKPELDSSGQLYSPKVEMLSGGSEAARGVKLTSSRAGGRLKPGQALQNVYPTRFIAYLSRFLLTFDPSAHAWWLNQGLGDTWEEQLMKFPLGGSSPSDTNTNSNNGDNERKQRAESAFAEYAESVEVGLADYFVGPYGSYSSLSAMKAGLFAAQPAPSRRVDLAQTRTSKRGMLDSIFRLGGDGGGLDRVSLLKKKRSDAEEEIQAVKENAQMVKQGILNLYTLLKARYTSIVAKRQLAILFSFISNPLLQPTQEISALLGEADNCTITAIRLSKPTNGNKVYDEFESRTSSRSGGGYLPNEVPRIVIDPPPALGDQYQCAKLEPVMQPTSRVLRINVLDGGEGYTIPPTVRVIEQSGYNTRILQRRVCEAAAILDRDGHVEEVIVIDPGYGYGGGRFNNIPPKVEIQVYGSKQQPKRVAKAVAELEYEIAGITIARGGNGYVKTEPPKIQIEPPANGDPDWYLQVQEQPELRLIQPAVADNTVFSLRAKVSEMKFPDGNVAYSFRGIPYTRTEIDEELISRLQRDPLDLLPSSVRPELRVVPKTKDLIYTIPSLDVIPQFVASMSPRYRAFDPVFGGVGKVPVQKGAMELRPDEYGRLALSGAVCTVLVRTALNPLELIKTKQQLLNDEELLTFARDKKRSSISAPGFEPNAQKANAVIDVPMPEAVMPTRGDTAVAVRPPQTAVLAEAVDSPAKVEPVGTFELMLAMAELRGPLSLFQSADITFLASLVFGSFGFGATELFRRSFTAAFFTSTTGASEAGQEVILLVAAALATVLTAAAAAPFEVLRVRSMGLLESTKWTNVLRDFLDDGSKGDQSTEEDFDIRSLKPQDLLPLWSGFAPTLSRELPFAIAKFLVFDSIAKTIVVFLNGQAEEGALPIQVGVGPIGLTISACAGAIAGIAGAIVSHPADLILTKTSARSRTAPSSDESSGTKKPDWKDVVKEITEKEGGIANLFVGLGARSTFFFLVIGLQFFLYDYVKNLFQVGSDDLNLVLDVFYAVRAGLPND